MAASNLKSPSMKTMYKAPSPRLPRETPTPGPASSVSASPMLLSTHATPSELPEHKLAYLHPFAPLYPPLALSIIASLVNTAAPPQIPSLSQALPSGSPTPYYHCPDYHYPASSSSTPPPREA